MPKVSRKTAACSGVLFEMEEPVVAPPTIAPELPAVYREITGDPPAIEVFTAGKQVTFFDIAKRGTWEKPNELPIIQGRFKRIGLDDETTGKNKFKDTPVGTAIATPDGKKYYIPHAHEGGGNYDPDLVHRWKREQLRDITIVNLNTGYDAEVERNDGIDLEAQGCLLHDVAHSAALLNENRVMGFNLNDLGLEYCGYGKLELEGRPDDIYREHSSRIGHYAENDAALALAIDTAQRPLIEAEGLQRVEQLEDRLIWANNHMERSALRIDVPKLEAWSEQLGIDIGSEIMSIWDTTGLKIYPNKTKGANSLLSLCAWADEDPPTLTQADLNNMTSTERLTAELGKVSFKRSVMQRLKSPVFAHAILARDLLSLKSKYISKLMRLRQGDLARFVLHQLRSSDEDATGLDGTVTGRYSSSGGKDKSGFNAQQWSKVEKQLQVMGADFRYIIRELFIPDDGFDFFASDASQIEFRLFAHYSNDADLIRRYAEDPTIDFHFLVTCLMNPGKDPVADYKWLKSVRSTIFKHINFGVLYGMGRAKLAVKLGLACICGDIPANLFWDNEEHFDGCPARQANDIMNQYHKSFPAAKRLMRACADKAEEVGFVHTLLGRRGRFEEGDDRFYKSLNKVIQGGAADAFKTKVLSVYDNRNTLGIHKLRAPVHDEQTGDISKDPAHKKLLLECLAEQDFKLKVDLRWDTKFGANWRECA
jgi:DNA polymerase-1